MLGITGPVGEFVPEFVSRINLIQERQGPMGRVFEYPKVQVRLSRRLLNIHKKYYKIIS
jgi:hypothetical protein